MTETESTAFGGTAVATRRAFNVTIPHLSIEVNQIDVLRDWYRAQNKSEATFKLDMSILQMLERAGVELAKPQRSQLLSFIARPDAPATRRSYGSRLRSVYQALHEIDAVDAATLTMVNTLPRPQRVRGIPRPTNLVDVARLLTVMPEEIADADRPTRRQEWWARTVDYCTLAVYAGLRVSEIAAVRGEDFFVDADGWPVLRVHGKGGRERLVPCHPAVQAVLRRYPTKGELWPVTGATVSQSIGDLMRMHGMGGKGNRAHTLRHRAATSLLAASGGNLRVVQQFLGHADVSTTQVYAGLELGEVRKAVLALPDFAMTNQRERERFPVQNLPTGCMRRHRDVA